MPTQYETTLLVADLDRSVAFYEDVLDLSVAERRGSRVAFDTGDCALVLEGELDDETLAAYGLDPPGADPGRGVLVSLLYDDVDAVHDRAAASDLAEVLTEPREAPWGERLFLVADPDGYVLDVAEEL